MTAELARYDAMCRAIDEAYQIDEVKDIRDKALALEVYARQAKNIEAERRACEIRLRAERKAGELRRQEEKSHDGKTLDIAAANSLLAEKKARARHPGGYLKKVKLIREKQRGSNA